MNTTTTLLLLATLSILIAGCGEADGSGATAEAPSGALSTRTDSQQATTLDGVKTYGYKIDLPPDYVRGDMSGIHLWQVEGVSSKKAPRIRVALSSAPKSLDAAAAHAAKGPLGPREVIFKEESDTTIVVLARDPSGEWIQADGWVKGAGLTMHCWIELHKVAPTSGQVGWAKRVARSLRGAE